MCGLYDYTIVVRHSMQAKENHQIERKRRARDDALKPFDSHGVQIGKAGWQVDRVDGESTL